MTRALFILGLCLIVFAVAAFSMMIGRDVDGFALLAMTGDEAELASIIFREIRLPRVLLAIVIGATLGLSGAALQGLLRNPLASPDIIGASSGASLGAVLTFYFGLSGMGFLVLPIGGMAGAITALGLLYFLAGYRADITTLILAGVAVTSLCGAMTALALNLAPSPFAIYEIVFWLMGSLADRSMEHVAIATPFAVIGAGLILSSYRALDALTLGEETAVTLGHNPVRLRASVIIGSGIAVGACVSVAGVIGFIGLIVPHLVRPYVGYRPSAVLVPSAFAGAILTLLSDIVVRLLPGQELKLGVITSLIGAPFFLYLIMQLRAQNWGRP